MSAQPGPLDAEQGAVVRSLRGMHPYQLARWLRTGLDDATLARLVAVLPAHRQAALAARAGAAASTAGPLAAAIRTARDRAGLTQRQLAELLGIRQSSVGQWERGFTCPAAERMVSLHDALPDLAALLEAAERPAR